MSPLRSSALGLLTGACLLSQGCLETWQQARFERDVELTFAVPPSAGIGTFTENGAVRLAETERADVLVRAHIRATTQERADAVVISGEVVGEEWLEIHALWPDSRTSSEGVSFSIDGPGGRPVRVRTSNGQIGLTGFADGADLRTSNGAITVKGHSGRLDAETSNGAVTVLEACDAVAAETSNGSVRIELADEGAGPVRVGTSNGGVTLVVGPAFAGQIEGETSNGSVTVGGGVESAGVRLLRDGRASKRVQIREGESVSTIRTSNGAIRITVRE